MHWRGGAGITAASVAALLCGSIGAGWAQAAPAVPARFGTHPTYDRLVLDWPSNVGYRVDQQGATATVVFDQAATLDEAQIRRDLARMAAAVTVTHSGGAPPSSPPTAACRRPRPPPRGAHGPPCFSPRRPA